MPTSVAFSLGASAATAATVATVAGFIGKVMLATAVSSKCGEKKPLAKL